MISHFFLVRSVRPQCGHEVENDKKMNICLSTLIVRADSEAARVGTIAISSSSNTQAYIHGSIYVQIENDNEGDVCLCVREIERHAAREKDGE